MMFVFRALLRKVLRKKHRHAGFGKFAIVFILLPLLVLSLLIFAFFLYDDSTMLMFIVKNQTEQQQEYQDGISGYSSDWTPNGATTGATSLIGKTGVDNMYINKMQSGYYKELLEILRDHANWTYMNDDDPENGVPAVTINGEKYYPSLTVLLGVMVSEGGAENEGGARVSPATTLSSKYYSSTDGKHSLGTYNSKVAAEDGGASLASGYFGNLDLYYNGAYSVRTNLQFTADFAAIYPSGRYVDEATYYPSKMNGYGISSGTVRTKADTDAAYLPDQVSIVLQYATSVLRGNSVYFDAETLTETARDTVLYIPYNYGTAGGAYAWGLGISSSSKNKPFTRENWSSRNTISFSENASISVNFVDKVIEESLTKLSEGWLTYTKGMWDGTNYNLWYINHSDYEGFGIMSLLMNGCFITPEKRDKLDRRLNDGGFVRGATVAYRLWSGNATATSEDMRTWVTENVQVKSVDESIYGPAISGGGSSLFIHYFDEDNKIYRDDGSGPYPALRSYGDGVRGEFMTRICGVIVYWKMLQASGVECTFQDAYLDNQGLAVLDIPEEPTTSTSTGTGASVDSAGNNIVSENAAAVAYQMARCMVAYSYPEKSMGVLNNGTELYQFVHKALMPGDIYFQSCDRGVATAVLWSGADSSFPKGSTRDQVYYLIGTYGATGPSRWEEVDWGGDVALLKPGDILIWNTNALGHGLPNGKRPGHIVMYVGNDLICEFHGADMAEDLTICHASLEDSATATGRSPTVDAIYKDLLYFKAFRLTNPKPNDTYINVAPYP